MDEFAIIHRFFTWPKRNGRTLLGVGDDAALIRPVDRPIAITTDTLVEGVHFLPEAPSESVGHRALAVNLSDLAAMGAEPSWALLAMTLPEADIGWLERFRRGAERLARRYGIDLIGGDTTRGPCTVVTVTALGEVPEGEVLRRFGAKAGDLVCVTGTLGDAALGLKMLKGEIMWRSEEAVRRHLFPEPQVGAGLLLRGRATACIDLSDGLLADLGHILEASGVGATLEWEALPLSPAVRRYLSESGDRLFPLREGEDYHLCFTLPPAKQSVLEDLGLAFYPIGTIEGRRGLRIRDRGEEVALEPLGYRHFGKDPASENRRISSNASLGYRHFGKDPSSGPNVSLPSCSL